MAAFKFGKKPILPAPVAATEVMPDSKETEAQVATQIRMNEANSNDETAAINEPQGAESIDADRVVEGKLKRLIDDDFPFDESQLAAIEGIASQRFACMTGAAGTGKTTSTKAIVDRIMDSIGMVDMKNYFKRAEPGTAAYDDLMDERNAVENGDYETPDSAIPSIALVGFTGRSSQMIKKNFPREWHGNIMTIHRMLAFGPEFYEDFDPELGEMRNKMRFMPFYTAYNKLPWDVIVIDEAGMVSIDLWEQVWAAAKEGCRIIMIGDINQLPPVHGRSIFGFAMTQWPSWELTHIHRQVGANNSIVDNAWKVLKGYRPESDNYQSDPAWKFAMMPIPEDSALASRKIRAWLAAMNGKAYHPHRDSVITAINAAESGNGYALGQIPMNRELAIVFNKESPRYIIDAGRERKQFAVGDKVMATRNDHEAGITNGMTGIIIDIKDNAAYTGDRKRFGLATEVNAYLNDEDEDEDGDFSLDDIKTDMSVIQQGMKDAKEKKDRGPASHIVTVRFGDGEHSFELPFATLAEVGSLMVAYVVTCHKMQGGESPLVVIICHQAHRQMLNREWLYTAITRASHKCVLFFTDMGLRAALSKQRIKGSTLAQKVRVFQELQSKGVAGAAINVALPLAESLGTALAVMPQTILEQTDKEEKASESGKANLMAQIARAKARRETKVEPEPTIRERVVIVERTVHHHHHATPTPTPRKPEGPRDGGRLHNSTVEGNKSAVEAALARMTAFDAKPRTPAIAQARKFVTKVADGKHERNPGWYAAAKRNHVVTTQLLLTHQPTPSSVPVSQKPTKFRFGAKK